MKNLAVASCMAFYVIFAHSAAAETESSAFHALGDMIVRLDDITKVSVSAAQVVVSYSVVQPGHSGTRPGYQSATLGKSARAEDIKFFTDLASGHWPREIDETRSRTSDKEPAFINPRKVSLVARGRVRRGGAGVLSLYDEHGLWLGDTSVDNLGDQLPGLVAELNKGGAANSSDSNAGRASNSPRSGQR